MGHAGTDSPTARALRALDILQLRPGVTAGELAERLGVSERAVRRYVEILRDAGQPVESVRGPHGGYRLGRGARLPPVQFTQAEALSLVMAVIDSGPGSLDPDDVVGGALTKVIRALPPTLGREAAAVRDTAASGAHGSTTRPAPQIIVPVVAAVAAHCVIDVTYRTHGQTWESRVDPWAVVVRLGRWYLLCRSHRADAVRTYRIDRIVDVVTTTDTFDPPVDLDAAAMLERHLGVGWAHATRVVFLAPTAAVAPYVRGPMGLLEDDPDGCVLVGTTSNPAMYAEEWLSTIPFDFRVEGGPELRSAVGEVGRRFTRAVADGVPDVG